MKKNIRTILNLLLAAVFLFSISRFLLQQQEKAVGSDSYADALALASSDSSGQIFRSASGNAEQPVDEQIRWVAAAPDREDPNIQLLEDMNLEALREVNSDVVGWILIPDTVINYPLMQGEDNDYYLERTWDGKKNAVGSVFLEYQSSAQLTDFNTIVYGHNMIDGSMFASLRNYREQDYWQDHPFVYIRSDEGVYRYEIFSSYLAEVESNTYGLEFPGEDSEARFLEWLISQSVIHTGVEPESTDRVLTLSTCSGRGHATRWVVHARLKMVPESGF